MLWVLVLTMTMTTIALATLHKHCDVRDADDEYYGGRVGICGGLPALASYD